MPVQVISSISTGFPVLSQSEGQVTHVLLTRSPLITQEQAPKITVRLACVKHAASVRPEPGSNSPRKLDARGRSPGTSLGRARSSNDEACASFVCDPTTGRESRSFSNDGSQDGVIWACRTRRCAGALAFVDRLRTDDRLLALFSFQRSRARRHKMPPRRCGQVLPAWPKVRADPFGGELPPTGHSQEVSVHAPQRARQGPHIIAEDVRPVSTVSARSHHTRKRERTRKAESKYTRRRGRVNPGVSVAPG